MRRRTGVRPIGVVVSLVPVVDVVLVLVAFIILMAPYPGRWWEGLHLKDVPESELRGDVSPTVFVTAEGVIFHNGRHVNEEGLRFVLKLAADSGRDPVMVMSVEEGLPYGRLARLLRLAREEGIRRVALASKAPEEMP